LACVIYCWRANAPALGNLPIAIHSNREDTMSKFQVGKTYTCRSIGDHECIFRFEIVARTAKQMTINEHGEIYKRGIHLYDGVEHCKPHGTYSMCAIIRADRLADNPY
jgi:hypothetical protein